MKKTLLAIGTFAVASFVGYAGASALIDSQYSRSMTAAATQIGATPKAEQGLVVRNIENPQQALGSSAVISTDPCAAEKAALANATAKYVGALERYQVAADKVVAAFGAATVNKGQVFTGDEYKAMYEQVMTLKRETVVLQREKNAAQKALEVCLTNISPRPQPVTPASDINPPVKVENGPKVPAASETATPRQPRVIQPGTVTPPRQ